MALGAALLLAIASSSARAEKAPRSDGGVVAIADAGVAAASDAGATAASDAGAEAGSAELPQLPTWLPKELDGARSPAPGGLAQRIKHWRTTFLITDPVRGTRLTIGNGDLTGRSSPCSTFKIFHSLVGLETGVLKGLEHRYAWDGLPHGRPETDCDQTLQSAITWSVVWYFQRLATELGAAREQEFLSKAHYGNEDSSSELTSFWINGSLQISPDEQVQFLEKMLARQAPFSKRSIELVEKALVVQQTEISTLHGKTGSCGQGKLAWFVGWVEKGAERRVFALRLEAAPLAPDVSGPGDARPLAEEILAALGLL